MSKRWIRYGALAAASLGLSACVTGVGPSSGQKTDGPFLYQNRGVAHAPAVKQVDAASYNAVLGDRYWPQPGEFFFFKQVGVMVGNNGFRASRDGGAFWVTFGHAPQGETGGVNFFQGGGSGLDHSEVVAIPPGQTRTYTAGEAVMTVTTPGDIAREDEILVVVERGAAPTEDFGGPDQAYIPPPGAPGGYDGYQQSSYAPTGYAAPTATAPSYGQPASWAGQTAAR